MALVDRNTAIRNSIHGILKETIGEDYQSQLAKRCVLRKDDQLIKHVKKLGDLLNIKIIYTE